MEEVRKIKDIQYCGLYFDKSMNSTAFGLYHVFRMTKINAFLRERIIYHAQ